MCVIKSLKITVFLSYNFLDQKISGLIKFILISYSYYPSNAILWSPSISRIAEQKGSHNNKKFIQSIASDYYDTQACRIDGRAPASRHVLGVDEENDSRPRLFK